ncbi:BON domain-containing protein [Dysgonomonas massiliensis]|uniref:BON domain-containing protein n=1 Tax=Dysgonomonas massiliensis TaxID=2040292 RepID=UPI00135BD3E4|nr:BON domain-containing protein [Dysgonomonas massiliensis]
MKKYLVCLGILLASFMFYSCAPSDLELESAAKEVLLENSPTSSVSVNRGIATLSGPVETEEIKTSIEEKVKVIEGIKSVVNQLEVVPSTPILSKVDQDLLNAIEGVLKASNYANVKATVLNQEVTFDGTVPTDKDVKKISAIANQIKVAKLTNNVTVEEKK